MPCISKHYKNAFPKTQMHRSRNATPNLAPTTRHSSQCAQDLQSSALQECISKHSNAQIKECNSKHRPDNPMRAGSTKLEITRMHFPVTRNNNNNSKHRPNNATPNIAPTTRHSSQLHNLPNNSAQFPTRALPNSTYSTRKTIPTETRARGTVRSLPPHLQLA